MTSRTTSADVSLLDTEGMKVREWYVVYHHREPRDGPRNDRFFRWLKPGFRHVELARALPYGPGVSDVGWLLVLPVYELLDIEVCSDPRPPWVRCPSSTIQKVTVLAPQWRMRSWWDMGPPTCVEAAKWALGIRAFWVRTPYQLFKYIQKRGGVITSGRRRRQGRTNVAAEATLRAAGRNEREPQS